MQAYEYRALQPSGQETKGLISADSERAARQQLRQRGLAPIAVAPVSQRANKVGTINLWPQQRRLSARVLAQITRQLATMIAAASPVEEALDAAARSCEKDSHKAILLGVRSRVMAGEKLAQAMAAAPHAFPALYRATVAAGEKAGELSTVFDGLADYVEKSYELKSKVRTALIYPAALAVTAVTVVTILMVYVIPRVVAQLEGFGAKLPWLTQIMIASSEFLTGYGIWLLLACVGGIAALSRFYGTTRGRWLMDGFILRVPLIGKLTVKLNSARFARSTASLIRAGSPLLDALQAARGTLTNMRMQKACDDLIEKVRSGRSLAQAFAESAGFHSLLGFMAAAGEESGRLGDTMAKTAEYLEKEFDHFTHAGLSLLEPAIIIFMGAIVAVIVLSILLPILQLNTLAAL